MTSRRTAPDDPRERRQTDGRPHPRCRPRRVRHPGLRGHLARRPRRPSSACASRRSSTSSRRRRRCSTRWSTARPTELAGRASSAPSAGPGAGFDRVEAIVRSVFRLAARRPELLGLLREVSRLGPPASTRLTERARRRSSTGPPPFLDERDGRRAHAPPRPPAAPAGRLLDGHRPGHRGRGAAGLRRGADAGLAGAPARRADLAAARRPRARGRVDAAVRPGSARLTR